jgi:hypothetical protein
MRQAIDTGHSVIKTRMLHQSKSASHYLFFQQIAQFEFAILREIGNEMGGRDQASNVPAALRLLLHYSRCFFDSGVCT